MQLDVGDDQVVISFDELMDVCMRPGKEIAAMRQKVDILFI